MSTSFAAALASIVPPLGLTIDRRVITSRAFLSPQYPRRVQSKAAAGTSSDPNPTADPAEVYAVGETADDGEHIVSAAAWVVARQSSLDSDGRCGVFAMYDPSDKMLYAGYAKDAVSAVRTYVEKGLGTRVRVAIFANRAMATRVNLRAEQDRWIGEWIESNGGGETAIPPGNAAVGAAHWTLPAEDWDEEPASSTAAAPAAPAAASSLRGGRRTRMVRGDSQTMEGRLEGGRAAQPKRGRAAQPWRAGGA